MITQHDITALTNLLQRTPMLPAEAIYAAGLLERLAELAQPAAAAPIEPAPTPKPKRSRRVKTPAAAAVESPLAPLRPGPLAGY
jgi:hypothetical protein